MGLIKSPKFFQIFSSVGCGIWTKLHFNIPFISEFLWSIKQHLAGNLKECQKQNQEAEGTHEKNEKKR